MKRLSVLTLLGFVACISPTSVPDLGDRLHLPPNSGRLMIASAQTWPHQEMSFAGVIYDVATNDRNLIAYISTQDSKFRTPEGLSVDSTLAEVMKSGAKAPWAEPGWAYHTKLPSGWSAAFISGREGTNLPLQQTSKVSWFFKRK